LDCIKVELTEIIMDILMELGSYFILLCIWIIVPAIIIRLLLNLWLKKWSKRAIWWTELGIIVCLMPLYAVNFYTLGSASGVWIGGYTDTSGKQHGVRFVAHGNACHWYDEKKDHAKFPCSIGRREIEIRDESGVIATGKANWNNTTLELRSTKPSSFFPQTITFQRYNGDH
jgi:hypothetical protein